jgi:hypothetical protein
MRLTQGSKQNDYLQMHYVFWATLETPNLRQYCGIKMAIAPDAEAACFCVGSTMGRALKRTVRVVHQKQQKI